MSKKIRKNDLVYVLAGKDKGKTGKVLKLFPADERAIVEGINFIKKHKRKTREDQAGGIIQMERPIEISNLAIFCSKCSKPTRIGITTLADGTKSRFCKRCEELI